MSTRGILEALRNKEHSLKVPGRLRTVGGRGEHSGRACWQERGLDEAFGELAGPVSDDIVEVHGDLRFRVAMRSASVPERAACVRRTVTSRQRGRSAGPLTGRARMAHWDGNARTCVRVETFRRSYVAATPNGSE